MVVAAGEEQGDQKVLQEGGRPSTYMQQARGRAPLVSRLSGWMRHSAARCF